MEIYGNSINADQRLNQCRSQMIKLDAGFKMNDNKYDRASNNASERNHYSNQKSIPPLQASPNDIARTS